MIFKSFFYLLYMLVVSRFKIERKDAVVDLASVASFVKNGDDVCALVGYDLGYVAELTGLIEKPYRKTAKTSRFKKTAIYDS